MDIETIDLPPMPGFGDSSKSNSPAASPRVDSRQKVDHNTLRNVSSLLHSISNKEKVRRDIDHKKFMKHVGKDSDSEDEREKKSNDSKKTRRSRDSESRHSQRSSPSYTRKRRSRRSSGSRGTRRSRHSNKSRQRKGSGSPSARTSAQNIFHHLKKVSDRVEREDDARCRVESAESKYRRRAKEEQEEMGFLIQSFQLLRGQGATSDMRMDSSVDVDSLRNEVKRMETELNSQKCVKFMRKSLIALVSFIEFANSRYDPLGLHLSGWSEHVMTTLGDYDSCFMRLYDKYRVHGTHVAPEAELLLLLGGSGMMFHITQAFVSQNVPKFTDVAKESPDLADKIAKIMAERYKRGGQDAASSSSDDDDDIIETESVKTAAFTHAAKTREVAPDSLGTSLFPRVGDKRPVPRPATTRIGSDAKTKLTSIPEVERTDENGDGRKVDDKILVLGA